MFHLLVRLCPYIVRAQPDKSKKRAFVRGAPRVPFLYLCMREWEGCSKPCACTVGEECEGGRGSRPAGSLRPGVYHPRSPRVSAPGTSWRETPQRPSTESSRGSVSAGVSFSSWTSEPKAFARKYPGCFQVACLSTEFNTGSGWASRCLPPRVRGGRYRQWNSVEPVCAHDSGVIFGERSVPPRRTCSEQHRPLSSQSANAALRLKSSESADAAVQEVVRYERLLHQGIPITGWTAFAVSKAGCRTPEAVTHNAPDKGHYIPPGGEDF